MAQAYISAVMLSFIVYPSTFTYTSFQEQRNILEGDN